jgi:hypothetical protein
MIYNNRRIPIKPLFWALSHKFRFELSRLSGNSTNGDRHASSIHLRKEGYLDGNPKNKMEILGG